MEVHTNDSSFQIDKLRYPLGIDALYDSIIKIASPTKDVINPPIDFLDILSNGNTANRIMRLLSNLFGISQ